jgi:hypothetical protein
MMEHRAYLPPHQVFAGLIGWLSVWLSVALPVVVGHSYGATIYFFKIWTGDWPCFRGEQVRATDCLSRYIANARFDLKYPHPNTDGVSGDK